MKKIATILFPVLLAVLSIGSCTEDNGNYTYTDVPTIHIDTVGLDWSVFVKMQYGTTISDITPGVIYERGTENLQYAWTLHPHLYNEIVDGNDKIWPKADTVCRTQSFHWTVDLTPGLYQLNFAVYDPDTDMTSRITFGMMTIIDEGHQLGIYCLAEYDGKTDIDVFGTALGMVIGGTHFTARYLCGWMDEMIEGEPLFVMACEADNNDKWVYVFTDRNGYRFNSVRMDLMDTFEEMFYEPVNYNPQAILATNKAHFLINDGKLHVLYIDQTNDRKFSAPIAGNYTAFPYLQSNTITDWRPVEGAIDCHQMIFDTTSKAFRPYFPKQSSLAQFSPTAPDAFIDANNMPGTMKAIFEGGTGITYCILEDAGKHFLYLINIFNVVDNGDLSAIGAGSIVDLQYCQDIASAKYFSGTDSGTAMFYATDKTMYSYSYSAGGATPSNTIYECEAGEEITCIYVEPGGGWPTGGYVLWVAVWNESEKEGKILEYEVDATSGIPQQVLGPMFGVTGDNPNIVPGTGKIKSMSINHYS